MDRLIQSVDWGATPIGPIETWSPALRMMVGFMLANRFPLLLWWGPHYVSIYNDAYRPILGAKHPKSMGQPVSECWSEIWHILQPLIDTPFRGGPATWMEDILLEINRFGFVEETHFTIAYSPVPDETAPRGIGGVLATVHEITEKVVGERRGAILRELGARAGEAKTAEEACAMAAEALSKYPQDVPFAMAYLLDPDGKRARLAGVAGTDAGEPVSPAVIELDDTLAPWPFGQALQAETMQVIEDIGARFASVPPGPWGDPPHSAVVLPIPSNTAHRFGGLLVVGVSSRLRLDDRYRDFLELTVSQIATAINNARAYEEERKRAEALAEVDRAKTLFFSNVSHEFRTPLTLMLGPLEDVLRRPSVAEEDQRQLTIAHRNSLRLLKLVNTLLDFSRVEAGRAQTTYQATDLAAATADLASNFRSACERADLDLIVDCPPLPDPVHVDRDMWEKIVLNLLSNAFKFTFEGEIEVRLRASEEEGVESGEGGVESGEWRVARGEGEAARSAGPELSRAEGVASGDGPGGAMLSSDKNISEGREVRPDEPDQTSRGVDPSEYRRGTGEESYEGVSEPSDHGEGIAHGIGDASAAQSSDRLAGQGGSGTFSAGGERNQSDAFGPSESTSGEALNRATPHSPLSTRSPHAVLTVRDTGTGIPEAELPHMFERFHRVENARGRTHEGTGIGLALVQELVRLHGGTVEVASVIGEGTTFTVRVPIGTAHLPADRIDASRTQASTAMRAEAFVEEALRWLPDVEDTHAGDHPVDIEAPAAASPGRPRVLFADDNADMRDYVRRILQGRYEVETFADGEAALEAAKARRPDLLLTDAMMPRLDGFGLLSAIRGDPDLRDVPVIMLSARAGEEARLEGLEAGADDYLTKPFSARELAARIGSNLELGRIRREADKALREEARTLEILNRIGSTIAAELDLERAVQTVTDAATQLTGAAFGSFFYNVTDERGESYMLYTLSGVPKEAFSKFPLPRNTAVFGPTFAGEGMVRSDDILKDPRYGKNDPYYGMPKGHLPVRSYLAAPVISRSGEVLGGLFFGHPEPGVFTERAERLLQGIAPQAATAIDNARAYQAAQTEIRERRRAEQALSESEERLRQANAELGRRVAELQSANREIQDARRAALNLMEDAVQSHRAAEESEHRLREMIDALPAAAYTTDAEGRITHFNPAAVEFSGRSPEPGADKWFASWKLFHPDGRPMPPDEWPMAVALREGRAIRDAEAVIERPDGERSWFVSFPTPLRDPGGRIVGGIDMLVDITHRKQAEQRQQLLTNEIAHRGKNLLAVVQTIASRSLSGTQSAAEAREALMQRIQALARSQNLLTDGAFEGASVSEVVRLEFDGFSDRVEATGPDVILNSKTAQTFALLVHELATNATKHGSLSDPNGKIGIAWAIEGAGAETRFRLRWRERDGPPVKKPTHQGFGTILVEKAVAQEFGAKPKMTFAPEGLVYEIEAPLSAVAVRVDRS